jgi:hypothetical protein
MANGKDWDGSKDKTPPEPKWVVGFEARYERMIYDGGESTAAAILLMEIVGKLASLESGPQYQRADRIKELVEAAKVVTKPRRTNAAG